MEPRGSVRLRGGKAAGLGALCLLGFVLGQVAGHPVGRSQQGVTAPSTSHLGSPTATATPAHVPVLGGPPPPRQLATRPSAAVPTAPPRPRLSPHHKPSHHKPSHHKP